LGTTFIQEVRLDILQKLKFMFDFQIFPTVTLYVWVQHSASENVLRVWRGSLSLSLILQFSDYHALFFGYNIYTGSFFALRAKSAIYFSDLQIFRLSRFMFGE